MDFFFVMSGFLITRAMLALEDRPNRVRLFFAARAMRILPALLLTLLAVALLNVVLRAIGSGFPWGNLLPYLFFYQNLDFLIYRDLVFGRVEHLSHLWSVIVEEHFYLIWGTIGWTAIASFKRAARPVISLAFGILVAGFLIRVFYSEFPHITLAAGPDGFVAGCLLALAVFAPTNHTNVTFTFRMVWLTRILLFLCFGRLLFTAYVSIVDPKHYQTGIYTSLDLACYSIVSTWVVYRLYVNSTRFQSPSWVLRAAAWAGDISYELYLIHVPLLYYLYIGLLRYHELRQHEVLALTFALTLPLAHFLNKYVTKPALARRERLSDLLIRLSLPRLVVNLAKRKRGQS
jgi:peptidoglycan/LPS O-acetylase OafA/YrhL